MKLLFGGPCCWCKPSGVYTSSQEGSQWPNSHYLSFQSKTLRTMCLKKGPNFGLNGQTLTKVSVQPCSYLLRVSSSPGGRHISDNQNVNKHMTNQVCLYWSVRRGRTIELITGHLVAHRRPLVETRQLRWRQKSIEL